jgi:hypothetical protein
LGSTEPDRCFGKIPKKFLTLFAGMALGLFAQIGLITHLYLCPRLPFAGSRRHRQCAVFTAADCPSRIS